jgi:hypothetical protein
MTSFARIRPTLRRAAFVAALGAIMAPATAGAAVHAQASAKKKAKAPVVTSVRPLLAEIGQTLEIRGKYFVRGRNKNSVVFKRTGGKAVFVKAMVGTTKLLRVKLPAKLQKEMTKQGTSSLPTRFRVRVLSRKFGKKYTKLSRSPVISPPSAALPPGFVESQPDGDCDNDGTKNRTDNDDDNDALSDGIEESLNLNPCKPDTDGDGVEDRWEYDCDRNGALNRDEADDDKDLLSDGLELTIGTNSCSGDSDGDGVEDGYEYQSALDLNDDENQSSNPNSSMPYPAKRPYPNPLFADAGIDYDGDVLVLGEEYGMWKKFGARTLSPLFYSDGEQYSISRRIPSGPDAGRREPTLVAATYSKRTDFVNWASAAGYRQVELQDGQPWYDGNERNLYGLFDVNRDGTESDSERLYNDVDGDGFLSDDERDEDADGLTNYDESHGRMYAPYWKSCYTIEKPYYVPYEGSDIADADSDGDGVRDGADDQDHDDIPNLMELSRFDASGYFDGEATCKPDPDAPKPPDTNHPTAYGRVNPFNPCLPYIKSRTCAKYVNDATGAPFDGSPNWYSLN